MNDWDKSSSSDITSVFLKEEKKNRNAYTCGVRDYRKKKNLLWVKETLISLKFFVFSNKNILQVLHKNHIMQPTFGLYTPFLHGGFLTYSGIQGFYYLEMVIYPLPYKSTWIPILA